MPDPDRRRRFLDERRAICRERFDTSSARVYDDRWGGYLNPTHERCLRDLVAGLPAGRSVLDAACGTGKYGAYHRPVRRGGDHGPPRGGLPRRRAAPGDGYVHVLLSV